MVPLQVDGLQLNDVARLNAALREAAATQQARRVQDEAQTTELYESAKSLGLLCDVNELPCAVQLGQLLEVRWLVFGRATGLKGGEAGLDLRLIDVAGEREARRAVGPVPVGEGSPDVEPHLAALFSAGAGGQAVVALSPPGALLLVDGSPEPAGEERKLRKLSGLLPGPHLLVARADGFVERSLRFEVGDEVAAHELRLEPLPDLIVERELSPLEIALPFAAAGTGVLLAAGGAVAMALGAQPYLEHQDRLAAIDALEPGPSYQQQAATAYEEARGPYEAWTTWGQATVVTGAAVAAIGVVVSAAGAVWGALLLSRDAGEPLDPLEE